MSRLRSIGMALAWMLIGTVAITRAWAQTPGAEACSLDDPIHCSSCRALAATVAKLQGGKDLSAGKDIDGALWTPLFTAYFLNCQDVGRTLVKRGADVTVGGRGGAMLAEVATQRAMNPDPKNYTTNTAWAGILEGGLIDLDARQVGGPSNREVWATPPVDSRQRYTEIWSRFERRSITTPMPPDAAEFDNDFPTPATGKTRPGEAAVSKGVEKFTKIYPRSGMAGLSVEIAGCYKWALQIAKLAGRRVALEHCAALDIVARSFDLAFTSKMNLPPTEFFEATTFERRINQIRDQAFEGMVWPVYRRNLEGSAMLWFDFHVELVMAREASTSAATGGLNPEALVSQWQDLNGQCRGGSGNEQKTQDACVQRERVSLKLGQAGYCYGRRGEHGYQMKWHVCVADSIR
jgi:hypothetical protein